MPIDIKRWIQYSLSLVLAAGLLWYVLSIVQPGELISRLRQANYYWILLSSAFSVVAYWSRAKRWCLLIEPVGYRPTVYQSFLSLMSGYFVNLFLPRVGEVTRCGILNKLAKIPVNIAFGTVVAERVFDVLMLFLLLTFTFILEFGRLGTFFTQLLESKFAFLKNGFDSPIVIIGILVGLITLVGLIAVSWRALQNSSVFQKIATFLQGVLEGILSVRKMKKRWAFLFHTILIWTMYFFMSYVLFFAMPQTSGLGVRAGLTILIMGGLGMSAPVQGGFGTFHFLVGNALVMYGLTKEDGIILATFMHTSQTLFMLLVGGISLLIATLVKRRNQVAPVNI